MSVVRSLVSNPEKGKLISSPRGSGKSNGVSESKAFAALKSHREAERRRRDRINAHLATLRGLLPGSEKMDKAALLARAVNRVKQLKATATQAGEGLHLPLEANEVKVEKLAGNAGDAEFLLRASLCCEYMPNILSDLNQAIQNLPIRLTKSEISIIGGRLKTVFLLSTAEVGNHSSPEAQEQIASSVHSALSEFLDKVSASAEYAEQLFSTRKRQRVPLGSSSSSS